jgi:serine/threonine-protein kinase
MTSTVPERGQVLAGKYRIDQLLGTGGMGVVVAATHLQLHSRVAIKFLSPDAVQNEAAAARLLREARASANIKSDHVARVIDVGTLESGAPYIVMEHLEGINLMNLLRQKGRLPIGEATTYLLQACDGVAHAHALGIVHRDLKPSNLFATKRTGGAPSIKVLDFGLSKVTEPGGHLKPDTHLTSTTDVIGSPIYMSPEQLRSTRDVDARTDIWALGTILFELIAGQPPFRARTLPQLCMLILHSRPRSLRELCPEAPTALETVVRRCLEKDPAKRFGTVLELAQALAPFASAPASGPLSAPTSHAGVAHSSTAEDLNAARGVASRVFARRTWAAVFVAIGAAASFTLVMRGRWRRPVALASHEAAHAGDPQAACASLGTTACSTCVAANCCGEYRACQADAACRQALEAYNGCVQSSAPSKTATCTETFGTHPNPEARNLASCAFVKVEGPTVLPGRCAAPCEQAAIIDDACAAYCACMKQSCQITLSPAACPSACAELKPDQIICRTYHCFLGAKMDPEVHCEHAVGHLNTCL